MLLPSMLAQMKRMVRFGSAPGFDFNACIHRLLVWLALPWVTKNALACLCPVAGSTL